MTAGDAWVATVERLWPGATVELVQRDGESGAHREFAFLPDAKRPRLLLPAGASLAGAGALRRYSHDLGIRQRITRSLSAAAMRTGLPERTLRDRVRISDDNGSVESHLSSLLGRRVVASIGLGSARANRKPILHLLTPDGVPVAFVKVGDSPTTRELIAGESAALRFLEEFPPPGISVPRVLHHGEWADTDLLVLSALPTSARGWRPRRRPPLTAMRSLFGTAGTDRGPLRASRFLAGVGAAVAQVVDTERAERLDSAICRIGDEYGDVELTFGTWHGDWTPWNMAWHRGVLQLWDFERLGRDVPDGFDLLHYRVQESLRSATGPAYAVWPRDAAGALDALGITGRGARVTTELYFLELCRRYLLAAQGPIGGPLRRQADGLLDLLADNAGRTA